VILPRVSNEGKVYFKKAYKLLKIDYDFSEECDSQKEMPTNEFEEGDRWNANTPKGNMYFRDNPFMGVGKAEEQGSNTIDETKDISFEEGKVVKIRPTKQTWLSGGSRKMKKHQNNLSYNSSLKSNRIIIDANIEKSHNRKYKYFVRKLCLTFRRRNLMKLKANTQKRWNLKTQLILKNTSRSQKNQIVKTIWIPVKG
jgi:hypothetical protein